MDDFKFSDWFGNRNFRFIGPAFPYDQSNNDQMADFFRRTVSTIWHYHGGCVVGRVVSQNYHVIVIGALRVVDGSTLSVSPGTNPQATLMMLGRSVLSVDCQFSFTVSALSMGVKQTTNLSYFVFADM